MRYLSETTNERIRIMAADLGAREWTVNECGQQ